MKEVVTEWLAAKRLAYRALSGGEMEAAATFRPEGGGTQHTFVLRYHIPGLWGRLIPCWLVKLGCQLALANIRRSLEARPLTENISQRGAKNETGTGTPHIYFLGSGL